MIATILPSSTTFHAVAYNEKKVAEGSAILMEMQNFGYIQDFKGKGTPGELVEYLQDYSSKNTRIKKPQFHMAFSCKGDDMSHEQLLKFAHQYLKEMGYGEEGQPLLVYAHSDTDNNHIHIITSRVDPNGKKIDNNNEKKRSQKIIDKLLKQNKIDDLKDNINEIRDYNFRSVTQYRAILEALGYKCNEKDNKLKVSKGGRLLASIGLDTIKKNAEINAKNYTEPNYNYYYKIFEKYRDMNSNMEELKKDLRDKFGLQLVTFGKKDSPYGYVVVDFRNKRVIEGSNIMSIKKLNQFQSPEEWKRNIESTVNKIVLDNPGITERKLNVKLRRQHAQIKDGVIICGKKKIPLNPSIKEILSTNEKLNWVNKFHPRNADEFKVLSEFAGLDPNKIKIPDSFPYRHDRMKKETFQTIRDIFASNKIEDIRDKLDDIGYSLITINEKPYLYSGKDNVLLDISENQNINLPNKEQINQVAKSHHGKQAISPKLGGAGSGGANREWEVGTKKNWDDVDDKPKSTMSY